MSTSLLRRLMKLERAADDDALVIYTHEREEPDGSLTLLADRTYSGNLRVVGHVPAGEVERHRRSVIRIERSYGRQS